MKGKTERRHIEIRLKRDAKRRGPGVLEGELLTYGQRAKHIPERFETGSLHWPEHGVVLREQHNRQAPIVRFVPIVDGKTVRVRAVLPDTQRGRDAATLVDNGTFRGLSVEFRSEREAVRSGVRSIQRAALLGAGLVDDPEYDTSVSVRETKPETKAKRWYW